MTAQEYRCFASDNAAGVHPDVMTALAEANRGYAIAYGADPWTARAEKVFAEHFGDAARAYPVLTGTGANVIALACVARPFHGVICADGAHLHRDECGAPEWHLGSKLLPGVTQHGKLSIEAIEPLVYATRGVHSVKPRVVTISQCTEVGTVYTADEVRAIADFCHSHDLLLHVDGARLCNAAAALDVSLRELTTEAGVDLLSFGGTKNGLMAAEAVLVLNPACGADVEFIRKQGMQLVSKMRFVSAQFVALLEGDLWLKNAQHANAMARKLADAATAVAGVRLAHPVETNGVFAVLKPEWIEPLQAHTMFHVWDAEQSIVRWMTAFDTSSDMVNGFVEKLRELA